MDKKIRKGFMYAGIISLIISLIAIFIEDSIEWAFGHWNPITLSFLLISIGHWNPITLSFLLISIYFFGIYFLDKWLDKKMEGN